MNNKIQLSLIYLMLITLFSPKTFAAVAGPTIPPNISFGQCWNPALPTYPADVTSVNFPSNTAGSTVVTYYQGQAGAIPVYCLGIGPPLFTLEFAPGMVSAGGNFYKYTDDLDVALQVQRPTGSGGYVFGYAPFNDLFYSNPVATTTPNVSYVVISSLTSGYITWRLRRSVPGGAVVIPQGIEIAHLSARLTTGTAFALPLAYLAGSGTVLPIPTECNINNGNTIDVDLGRINNTALTNDGSANAVSRALAFTCNTTISQNVKVELRATGASFNSDAIGTNKANLGVVMRYNGSVIRPGNSFNLSLNGGNGSATVTFAPLKNASGALPTTGDYNASATLITTIM